MSTTLFHPFRWLALALALVLPAPRCANAAKPSGKQFSNEQLDQLTAQVALYPDSLLAQVLMATTYPDDFAEAAEWSKAHPDAKGDDAVEDGRERALGPVRAVAGRVPEVLITLGEKPDWVKDLGDAFLAQPDDVMNSVQRLRAEGAEGGQPQVERAGQGVRRSPSRRRTRRAASPPPPQVIVIEPAQPRGRLRAVVQPGGRLRRRGRIRRTRRTTIRRRRATGSPRAVATGIAWGVGIGVAQRAVGRLQLGPRRRQHQRQPLQQHQHATARSTAATATTQLESTTSSTARGRGYRGGDATRQNLERKYQAGNREQYRGKDADRAARRQQAMQSRGVDTDRGRCATRIAATLQQQAPRPGLRSRPGAERGGGGRGAAVAAQSVDRERRAAACAGGESQQRVPGRERSPARASRRPRQREPAVAQQRSAQRAAAVAAAQRAAAAAAVARRRWRRRRRRRRRWRRRRGGGGGRR